MITKEERQKRNKDKRAWRKEMDNQLDLMEDQLKMALDLFTASHKIPNSHYKLELRCKVKFIYE